MLLNLIEHLQPESPLSSNVTGTVVDVDEERGRVKMIVKGYYEGSKENLPWIYPKNPPDQGGQQDASHHQMPDLYSTVMVSFPTGDIHHGQYDGKHTTPQASQSVFKKGYGGGDSSGGGQSGGSGGQGGQGLDDVPMDEDSGQQGGNEGGTQGQGGFGGDTPSGGLSQVGFTTMFGKIWKSVASGEKTFERHDKQRGVTERYHGKSQNYHRTEHNSGNETRHGSGRHLQNTGSLDDSGGGSSGGGGQGGSSGGDSKQPPSHNINTSDDFVVQAKNIVLSASENIYLSTSKGDFRLSAKNIQMKGNDSITGKSKKITWDADTVNVNSDSPKVKTPWKKGPDSAKDPDMKTAESDIKALKKMVEKLKKQVKTLDKQHQKNMDEAKQETQRLQGLVAQIGQGENIG